jgi:hypothetical protein
MTNAVAAEWELHSGFLNRCSISIALKPGQLNVQRVAVFGKLFSIKPNTRVGRTR